MRKSEIQRKTSEVSLSVKIDLDGNGIYSVDTGVGFFDHMLALFSKHSGIDLEIKCRGDLQVDAHHTVEDTGIVLGQAFKQALLDKRNITRYGQMFLPMDESLALVCVDISGRAFFVYDVDFDVPFTGDFDACLIEEFLQAFAFNAGITLHVKLIYGANTHHILEAVIKGLARALKQAVAIDPTVNGIPSTKGTL
jgi:imidazoleglycerol-phosphate dehydratase